MQVYLLDQRIIYYVGDRCASVCWAIGLVKDAMAKDDSTGREQLAPYASEFIGTFFLVFTVGLNVLQNHPLGPISVGFMLMAMIFTSGTVSGGHFNPAVTFGVLLSYRELISVQKALLYVAVQMLGALAGALTVWSLLGDSFDLKPGNGYSMAQAAMVEVLYSSALVFVVLNVATLARETKSPFQDEFAPLAIGLTLLAAAFACGAVSGCSLNPALAFGALFVHAGHHGLDSGCFALYTLCPFLGSAIAAGAFYVVRQPEYDWRILKVEKDRREGAIPDTDRGMQEKLTP